MAPKPVEDVVEEDGGPDDGEHEDGEVHALGGRDADVPPLGAEGQQREGDGEGARGRGGLLGGPVQPQHRPREHDKRRCGEAAS